MQELTEKIFEILKDYHCDYLDTKHKMSVEHILKWAEQFGGDGEFILTEFLHLLPNIYVSKEKAVSILKEHLESFRIRYKYLSMNDFIKNAYFIDLQREEKSQREILVLVKEILQKEYGINYNFLIQISSKEHYIYFGDILTAGGTMSRDLKSIIEKERDSFINKQKTTALSLFCYYALGYGNILWGLGKDIGVPSKGILDIGANYIIKNKLKPEWIAQKQGINCIYPINKQSSKISEYIGKLNVNNPYSSPTFRPEQLPLEETFFSSKENRNKFEKIILDKGLELLQKVEKENPDPRKRPLGDTVKPHKTLGAGTLFFTWRNISNTCPIAFWWNVFGYNWTSLFSLENRGI